MQTVNNIQKFKNKLKSVKKNTFLSLFISFFVSLNIIRIHPTSQFI